jgi:hypothetical protein
MTERLRPAEAAPDIVLYAPDGSTVPTSTLWADAHLVLAFQRHFG